MQKHITALLLAAGSSCRMQEHKILLDVLGKPLIQHALQNIQEIEDIIVVLGHHFIDVFTTLQYLPAGYRVDVVQNVHYKQGLSTSLITGLEAAGDTDAICICLGDMPNIPKQVVRQIKETFQTAKETSILVPMNKGKRGHPVLIPKFYFEEIYQLRGDKGANGILKKYQENIIAIETEHQGIFLDLDEKKDWNDYVNHHFNKR